MSTTTTVTVPHAGQKRRGTVEIATELASPSTAKRRRGLTGVIVLDDADATQASSFVEDTPMEALRKQIFALNRTDLTTLATELVVRVYAQSPLGMASTRRKLLDKLHAVSKAAPVSDCKSTAIVITTLDEVRNGIATSLKLSSAREEDTIQLLHFVTCALYPTPDSARRCEEIKPLIHRTLIGLLPKPAHIVDLRQQPSDLAAATALIEAVRPGSKSLIRGDLCLRPLDEKAINFTMLDKYARTHLYINTDSARSTTGRIQEVLDIDLNACKVKVINYDSDRTATKKLVYMKRTFYIAHL